LHGEGPPSWAWGEIKNAACRAPEAAQDCSIAHVIRSKSAAVRTARAMRVWTARKPGSASQA
jgi:hypothetical protein